MFNVIAPRYDRFTRIFSFGMDARWKRHILERISTARLNDGVVLDLACGTGDLSFAIASLHPSRSVVGIDVAERMIAVASERAAALIDRNGANPTFALADIMMLPVADNRVALVTAGYAFRNVPDFRVALRRLAALLPPGALLVVLDFCLPASRIWRAIFLGYLQTAGAFVGWLWHRSPAVYEYISHSIRRFVSADEFTRELQAAGFVVEHEKRWLLGGMAAHVARRR
jgi:demethylmenaquinone methyltransferase/2-methoxy-6-polyprenyl-1,4-benzoquinol methylase